MKVLYLGLDPVNYSTEGLLIYYPVIRIEPIDSSDPVIKNALLNINNYTHIIFTSKNAVSIFLSLLRDPKKIRGKTLIAIGRATAELLQQKGFQPLISEIATQEGMVELLGKMPLEESSFLLPGSLLSRPLIACYLKERGIKVTVCPIYTTVHQKLEPIPRLAEIDEIVFTSPSTVDGFFKIFPNGMNGKKTHCIGPITESYLQRKIFQNADEKAQKLAFEHSSVCSTCGNFLHSISSRLCNFLGSPASSSPRTFGLEVEPGDYLKQEEVVNPLPALNNSPENKYLGVLRSKKLQSRDHPVPLIPN